MANPLNTKDQIAIATDPATAKSLTELLQALRPDKGRWDMVAFTDGSGSTDEHPGGYAAVMLFRRKGGIHLISGSASNCTSQGAEVRAVFELANALVTAKLGLTDGGFKVMLVTDSQYVASSLASINVDPVKAIVMKSHRVLWLGIQYAARVGIRIEPHHIARNSNPLMVLADDASKTARKAFDSSAMEDLKNIAMEACKANFPLATASSHLRK